jgi:predicted site-specific integrase-resolvase
MSVRINGKLYYRTAEVCVKAGISRATLFRWLKSGILEKSIIDRRGWRLFTDENIHAIQDEAIRIEIF